MLISCRRATELVELRSAAPLSLTDRARLEMHLRICTACRRYSRQSALLDAALSGPGAPIPSEEVERVIAAVNDRLDR